MADTVPVRLCSTLFLFVLGGTRAAPQMNAIQHLEGLQEMMRMQLGGPPKNVEIQVHQVAGLDDYPLIGALRVYNAMSVTCMEELGVTPPDFMAEMAGQGGGGGMDSSETGKDDDDDDDDDSPLTTTQAPGTTTDQPSPTTSSTAEDVSHPSMPAIILGFPDPMTRMLVRFARRFQPMLEIWKSRVDGYQRVVDMIESDKMNNFIDSLTVEQFRGLNKCFNKKVVEQIREKIKMESGPVDAIRGMLLSMSGSFGGGDNNGSTSSNASPAATTSEKLKS